MSTPPHHRTRAANHDGAWKRALDFYFADFMVLLWPELHAQTDWTHPPVFLDKELQRLAVYKEGKARRGGRLLVDKLARVRLSGEAVPVNWPDWRPAILLPWWCWRNWKRTPGTQARNAWFAKPS